MYPVGDSDEMHPASGAEEDEGYIVHDVAQKYLARSALETRAHAVGMMGMALEIETTIRTLRAIGNGSTLMSHHEDTISVLEELLTRLGMLEMMRVEYDEMVNRDKRLTRRYVADDGYSARIAPEPES